ncbi:MAG: division/cell wall cluster transcriptional repressor MraZ [Candidatus Nanopelagicales bacterium]|jgi:MraZ protein|nr:division/cell wall cluster transcriptional repressor MraZ [Candidatus Nanopelagicales bacterium]MCU0294607.1 division/cell wall cluster transcriptional repressor MraZ [Candidatus Nanopelagicales bacterium]MCU0297821.1 division/cell wall cluster transcriptional repressor MraZ [Candidatus Nanopelagicales bacterium]
MFLGTHTPKVDDKGRVILPAKFRPGLSEGVVLTKGQDRSLVLWPIGEFEAAAARVREASQSNAAVRAYSRVLFSSAFDQVPDKQGRITVPPSLREYAGLDRECVVVGNHNTVEIWDEQAWQEYLRTQDDQFATLSEEVVPGLF